MTAIDPTSQQAANLERAWEAYYERFDTLEYRKRALDALMEMFIWDYMDDDSHQQEARQAMTTMIERLGSGSFVALYRSFDFPKPHDVPCFEDWQEERP